MKEQNQNESTVDVELLKSQLLHRKITIGRFRLPYSYEQTKDMLLAAYQAEVEYRCRHFTTCEEFESQRAQIARFLTGNSATCAIRRPIPVIAYRCGMQGNWLTGAKTNIRNGLG